MDDNSFDKIIKSKAEGYQDTGYDPQALADMRKRLAAMPATGGASRNWGKTAAVAAALVLFTLINFGVVWYFSEGRYKQLNSEMADLKAERSQLMVLQEELVRLQATKQTTLVDTIYVYKDIITTIPGTSPPSGTVAGIPSDYSRSSLSGRALDHQYMLIGESEEISEELQQFLTRNNLMLIGDAGEQILVVKSHSVNPVIFHEGDSRMAYAPPALPHNLPKVWDMSELTENTSRTSKKLDSKTLWALEKHQYSGVDFQFGVETMVNTTVPPLGVGDVNTSLGIMGEIIFSPTLRLETGIHRGTRSYTIKEKELLELNPSELSNYPGFDPSVGQIIRLESDAEVLKIPVNLKVMGILDHNKRWYISGGISPQWLTGQEFDYQYAVEGIDNPDDNGEEFRAFIGAKQDVTPGFSIGTLNLGFGTEVYINEKTRWQIGAYYEKSLGDIGAEKVKLNTYGLKTSIWLNKP